MAEELNMHFSSMFTLEDTSSLGVVHNCHHFHERTQRTLGGRGSRATVRFFKCRLQ